MVLPHKFILVTSQIRILSFRWSGPSRFLPASSTLPERTRRSDSRRCSWAFKSARDSSARITQITLTHSYSSETCPDFVCFFHKKNDLIVKKIGQRKITISSARGKNNDLLWMGSGEQTELTMPPCSVHIYHMIQHQSLRSW